MASDRGQDLFDSCFRQMAGEVRDSDENLIFTEASNVITAELCQIITDPLDFKPLSHSTS